MRRCPHKIPPNFTKISPFDLLEIMSAAQTIAYLKAMSKSFDPTSYEAYGAQLKPAPKIAACLLDEDEEPVKVCKPRKTSTKKASISKRRAPPAPAWKDAPPARAAPEYEF